MPRKDIEIRIAATGGDQAAAEIKKVEGAGEELNTSNVRIVDATKTNTEAVQENIDALKQWQDERRKAAGGGRSALAVDPADADRAAAEAKKERAAAAREVIDAAAEEARAVRAVREAEEEARQATIRLAEEKRNLAQAQRATRAQTAEFRRGIFGLNSALSNLGARVPIVGTALRGILNPIAAAGTAVGILVSQFVRLRREADARIATALDAAAAAAGRFAERMSKIRTAAAAARLAEFREALKDITTQLEDENRALTANATLLDARRQAQLRISEIQRGIRADEIAASDIPDDEKISKLAALDDERARELADAELQAIAERVAAAVEAADQAKRRVDTERENLRTAERLAKDEAANLAEAQQIKSTLDRAGDPDAIKKQLATERNLLAGTRTGLERLRDATRTPKQFKESQDRAARIESNIAQLETALAEAERAQTLLPNANTAVEDYTKKLEEVTTALDQQRQQTEAAARAAQIANEAEGDTTSEGRVRTEGILGIFAAEAQRRAARAAREQAAARAAAAEAKSRDEQKEEDDLARELEAAQRQAAQVARRAQSLLPKNVADDFRAAVEETVAGLQDGDQGEELDRLTGLMQKLARAVRGTNTAADIRLDQLEKDIQLVNDRVRNNPSR